MLMISFMFIRSIESSDIHAGKGKSKGQPHIAMMKMFTGFGEQMDIATQSFQWDHVTDHVVSRDKVCFVEQVN